MVRELIIENREQKTCPVCNKTKSITEFYKNRSMPDGHSAYCKQCERQKNAKVRNKAKEKVKENICEKKCSTCGEIKNVAFFYKNKSTRDGYSPECKECEKKRRKQKEKSGYKKCAQCHKIKPICDFYIDPSKKTHKRTVCNDCHELQLKNLLCIDMDSIPETKKCTKCGEIKNIDSFRNSKVNPSCISSLCKQCQAQLQKDWYENNKQAALNYTREYRDKHREHIRQRSIKYNHQHPWIVLATTHNRRAKMINTSDGSITPDSIEELYNKQNGLCAYCGRDLKEIGKHLDHIVPLIRGGSNTIDNVQWTCPQCNMRKNRKTNEEWFNDLFKEPDSHALKILNHVGLLGAQEINYV